MFPSWKQADTSPAGDSPILSCGHGQLPTRNSGLLQPLRECCFYSPKPWQVSTALLGEDWLPDGLDGPHPLPSLRLGEAGTSVSALPCCCHPLVPRDTCGPGLNGGALGGIRAAASGSISREVVTVPSGTELPKSGAGGRGATEGGCVAWHAVQGCRGLPVLTSSTSWHGPSLTSLALFLQGQTRGSPSQLCLCGKFNVPRGIAAD